MPMCVSLLGIGPTVGPAADETVNGEKNLQGLLTYLLVDAVHAGRLSNSVVWHCVLFVFAKPTA